MSVYLGYNTVTKQYLKDLVSNNGRVVREWMDYYVNVTNTVFKYPHGIANFPCFVRSDEIKEGTVNWGYLGQFLGLFGTKLGLFGTKK